MTVEEFMAWYDEQPEGERYELWDGYPVRIMADAVSYVGGEPVWMHAERHAHARAKMKIGLLLTRSVEERGLPCFVYGDGIAVRAGDEVFEPDASVRCGPDLPADLVVFDDLLVVVEVTSPKRVKVDQEDKLFGYTANRNILHYVIVHPGQKRVIWHTRSSGDESWRTTILGGGVLELSPPGVALDLDAVWASLPPEPETDGAEPA